VDLEASASNLDLPELGHGAESSQERLREIEDREAKLAEREASVAEAERKAEYIRKHGRNNWPPFYPLLYHSIEDEITNESSRKMVKTFYRLWQLLVIVLVINLVAGILLLVSHQDDGAKDMISSIVYVPVIAPLAFLLWYRCG
jgi:hypothetical protein